MEAPTCGGGTCELLGLFGIFVQGIIAAWCMLTLVVLWRCETPRRPIFRWLGDMSKQLVGAAWGHFMNVMLAIVAGSSLATETMENQCVWYLVGFLSDIVLGTFLSWWLTSSARPLFRLHCGLDIGAYEGIDGPEDNDDNEEEDGDATASAEARMPGWLIWGVQTGIWVLILTLAKMIVLVGVYYGRGPIYTVIALGFRWARLCAHQWKQLVFSVIVVPVIGDAIQFAVQDFFLKKNDDKHCLVTDDESHLQLQWQKLSPAESNT